MAHANSFSAGFVFDNKMLLGGDPRITAATSRNVHLILTQEYWYGWGAHGLYRPLTTLSYLFNYAILGDGRDPAGYHWINFALHAINIALVYLLAFVLFRQTAPAFALAAVWALHPILTESITNLVGRADLLAGFGVLAGLLCHIRAAAASGRRKWAWLAALMVVTGAGMFSKESAVVVLAAMLLYDGAFRTASWRARAPGYLAVSVPLVLFLYVRSRVLSGIPAPLTPFADNPLVGADFLTARLTAVKVIGKYLGLLAWPLHLSCDYSYRQIPLFAWRFHAWEDWKALAALAACLAAAGVAVRCYRRHPPVFFFIGCFFAFLAPAANLAILIGTIGAERLLYLPSIAFAGCLVLAIHAAGARLARRRPLPRNAVPAALAVICLAYAIRTYIRNFDWQDEPALWTSAAQVSPASFKTHMLLASALADLKEPNPDRSISEIERSMAILADLPDAKSTPYPYIDAGSYYGLKGESLAAPQSNFWYQKSLAVLLRAQRIEAALDQASRRRDMLRGEKHLPVGWYELYLGLGDVYLRLADPRQALEALEHGIAIRATPEFFEKMAAAYQAMGDSRQAAITLIEGLEVHPGSHFSAALVELYRRIDPQGCAVRTAGGSPGLNTQCPLVHTDLCAASQRVVRLYRRMNQEPLAVQTRSSAIRDLGCPAELFGQTP